MSFEKPDRQEIYPDPEVATEEKIQKMKNQFRQVYKSKDLLEKHAQIVDFIGGVKQKFPKDYQKYAAFHIAAGSTPGSLSWSEFPSNKIDFPGKYSVENFFDQLLEERKQEKQN